MMRFILGSLLRLIGPLAVLVIAVALKQERRNLVGAWRDHVRPALAGWHVAKASARSSLVGVWTEAGWKLCTPVPQLSAEQIDPPIRELWFNDDGDFSVTWRPFESFRDYWGGYRYDTVTHAIELTIEHGNFIPADFVGRGSAIVVGDSLSLTGVRLGTKEAKNRPEICELRFTRR
jgi:hypothetical protein